MTDLMIKFARCLGSILFLGFLFAFTQHQTHSEQYSLVVMYPKMIDQKGYVEASIYHERGFLKKKGVIQTKRCKVDSDHVEIVFENLNPGSYGVASYHDVNGNEKLDRKFLTMLPKEPVSVSNVRKKKLRKPKFKEAKVVLDTNRQIMMEWVTF